MVGGGLICELSARYTGCLGDLGGDTSLWGGGASRGSEDEEA